MREGNNILGVDACDSDKKPVAIRYLVDLTVPGAEITVSRNGKKYTVCKKDSSSARVVTHFCRWLRLADSWYATVWRPSVCPSVCLFRDCGKLHAQKNRRSVCRTSLMSRGRSSGRRKVTQGKLVLLAWVVRRGIVAGKTQCGLRTQPAAMLRSL